MVQIVKKLPACRRPEFSSWVGEISGERNGQTTNMLQFSSVHFSRSVVSDSLWPHKSQHARPPCPSPSPGVHPNSRPLSWWCHPAISSSVVPFSLLPPIPPSIRVFSSELTLCMKWPKYWSFSFSIIPSKEHPGLISFRMDWLSGYYSEKYLLPPNETLIDKLV